MNAAISLMEALAERLAPLLAIARACAADLRTGDDTTISAGSRGDETPIVTRKSGSFRDKITAISSVVAMLDNAKTSIISGVDDAIK